MKYFALTNNNSVVAKWADPRTVTFTSKSGRDAEVSEIVQEFELLRDYDVPMYTEERLTYFFNDIREINEEEYTGILAAIDQHNAEAKVIEKDIESQTPASMSRYVSTFSANFPDLLNFREVSELVSAFNDLREDERAESLEEDSDFNNDEDDKEYLKTIYALLKHVEKSSDPSVVKEILKVVGD
jgi:hypothetical protein